MFRVEIGTLFRMRDIDRERDRARERWGKRGCAKRLMLGFGGAAYIHNVKRVKYDVNSRAVCG